MKQLEIHGDLSGGELSPLFYGRFELPQYARSAKRIENVWPLMEGGGTLRGGTEYIGQTKSGAQGRIHPFIISPSLSYDLEFTSGVLRIWKNGDTLLAGEITTPFTSITDIKQLYFTQSTSWMIICHQSHPPKLLKYMGADSFETDAGALVNFTAADFVYNTDRKPFDGPGKYPRAATFFIGRLWFFSSLNKPQGIWASRPFKYKDFTFYDTIESTYEQMKNPDAYSFSADMTTGSNVLTVSRDMTGKVTTNHYITGVGVPAGTKVVSVTSTTITMSNAATKDGNDYGMVASLWYDATATEYETVTTTKDIVSDDNAMEFEIGSDQNDAILWAAPHKDLVIGTTISEWIIPNTVVATNIAALLTKRNGSAAVQPFMVGDALVFATGDKKGIRELYVNTDTGGYDSPEMAFFSNHLLEAKIKELDWQSTPKPAVFALLEDGTIAAVVYSRLYGISAWFRITTPGGTFESVSVLPGDDGDEVFVIVNRGGVRYRERFRYQFSGKHLDSAVTKTKTSGGITGVTHLSGAARVVYNGAKYDITITGGAATLPAAIPDGSAVEVGLPFTGTLSLLRPNVQSRYGTAQTRSKLVNRISFRLHESYDFDIGPDSSHKERTSVGTAPYSGDLLVPFRGTWDKDGWINIYMSDSLPVTILNIIPEVDAGG